MIEIKRLRELCEAATKGPWWCPDSTLVSMGAVISESPTIRLDDDGKDDAALIAAARNALPALLDFVDAIGTKPRRMPDGLDQDDFAALEALQSALAEKVSK